MEKFTKVLEEIQTANNTIFSVEFIKKDGSVRNMTARLHVKKGVKGTGMSYNPIASIRIWKRICCSSSVIENQYFSTIMPERISIRSNSVTS